MASKQKTPLMTDQQLHNGHNGHHEANGQETEGSEVMLTTLETSSAKPNYDSISEKKVLLPGDIMMTRDEVPPCPSWAYALYTFAIIATPIILTYLSYQYVDNPEQYLELMASVIFFSLAIGWFIGAVFYNLLGLPSNYTRKIGHIYSFMMPLLLAGGLDGFENDGEDGGFFAAGFDINNAFTNIIFDVAWTAWQTQISIWFMTKPVRACSNYVCGNTRSKRKLRWINCCENTMDAFERSEDRPNHLLWLNTQFLLYYVGLFALSFWWNDIDSGVMVLIPAFIAGLGDGLAEPVGVKFGKTGCGTGINCTYKTHGCCTKYDYVRSIPGSSMVLLSGYLGVALAYNEYTMWQFIIAMVVVPPVGTIVEAKAPHTLDNPFIGIIVGTVATAILYIPV